MTTNYQEYDFLLYHFIHNYFVVGIKSLDQNFDRLPAISRTSLLCQTVCIFSLLLLMVLLVERYKYSRDYLLRCILIKFDLLFVTYYMQLCNCIICSHVEAREKTVLQFLINDISKFNKVTTYWRQYIVLQIIDIFFAYIICFLANLNKLNFFMKLNNFF